VGQFTGSRSIPHRFFVTVPIATNKMPRKRTETTTTNTTFMTWSGIITSIRISKSTPTAILTRMAFAYFMRRSQLIMLHNRWSVPSRVTGHQVPLGKTAEPNKSAAEPCANDLKDKIEEK
jgi:hypothetical protein